ncbi:MAG: BatD family protein [Longimicrobiales bacterium]|nr:BatD family protein [Longimicrobiales bacterium]
MVASAVLRFATRGLVLALLTSALAPGVSAQEISARAFLSPGTTVGLGQSFVLNVEVTGAQRIDNDPVIPTLTGFAQYLGSGSSTNMQMGGGRTIVSLTIQYRYQALVEGTFAIPPVDVVVGGETLRTEALQLIISSAPPPQQQDRRAVGGGAQEVGPEDLFVTAEASRTTVRDGEPLVVEYRIWTSVDVSQYSFTSLPEPQGFWVEDITPAGQPQVEQRTRNGREYASAVIRRVAMVPTGSGPRTLDPLGIEAQVRVRNSRDPFEGVFGRSSLFGTSVVPISVLSNPIELDIQALPEGAPQPFSGVVGALSVTSSLDRDSVAANDAVTLTVIVSGRGNIRGVPAPELNVPPDFEVFPPEISQVTNASTSGVTGSKTFEFVMIPRVGGSRAIPSIEMGYFDLAAGEYRTAASDPLPLTIAAVGDASYGFSRLNIDPQRQDIRFIRLDVPVLRRMDQNIFSGAAFWMLALLPLMGIAGALGLRKHQDRLLGDVAYARGRSAGKVAKKRLTEARRLAGKSDYRAFYAEVARALRGLVADKLNVAEAGMQMNDLEAGVKRAGVADAQVSELRSCLELCDRQRFAPPSDDPGEKTRLLDRVGGLMTALDREIRR